jgi:exonuclease VII large subunit
MDQELQQHLDQHKEDLEHRLDQHKEDLEQRLDQHKDNLDQRFDQQKNVFEQRLEDFKEQLIAVIVDAAGSLHTQMQELETRMNLGFERVEARLGRHGGLIQGGSKQITRLVRWSERIDQMMSERDKKIAELEDRLKRLERNGRSG